MFAYLKKIDVKNNYYLKKNYKKIFIKFIKNTLKSKKTRIKIEKAAYYRKIKNLLKQQFIFKKRTKCFVNCSCVFFFNNAE